MATWDPALVSQILGLFGRAFARAWGTRDQMLTAALAYNMIFHLVPLTVLVLALGGALLPGLAPQRVEFAERFLPRPECIRCLDLTPIAENSGTLGLVGLAALALGGAGMMSALRNVLNIILEVDQPRSFLRGKLVDLSMIPAVVGLFYLSVLASLVLSLLQELTPRIAFLELYIGWGWRLASFAVGLSATCALFYLIFRVLPRHRLPMPAILLAAAATSIFFELAKLLLRAYVAFAHRVSFALGTVGGVAFFATWLYLLAFIFVLGAELARAARERSA